eukprot:g5411.t1
MRRTSTLAVAAVATSVLALRVRKADGHCFQFWPISRQFLHTVEFNRDGRYGTVEKWAGAYNGGGPGVIEQRQIERTDPDVLEKYGKGEVWPFAAAWDLGETLPNMNYYESDELAVSRNGVCGDTPQGGDDNPIVYSTPTREWEVLETFEPGATIEIKAAITAHHWGHFEFLLCNTDTTEDPGGVPLQSCFNEYPLNRAEDDSYNSPVDPDHPGRYYADPLCRGETGETDQTRPELGPGLMTGTVNTMRYKLPDIECDHCILMMRYFSGNTCKHPGYDEFNPPSWPSDCAPNKEDWIDTDAGECRRPNARWGNVFMGCSDIAIKSSTGGEDEGEEPLPQPTPAPTPEPVTPLTPAPEMPVTPPTPAPEMPVTPPTPAPEMPATPPTPAPEMPVAPPSPAPEMPVTPPTPEPEMPATPPTPAPEMPVAPPTPEPEMPVAPPTPEPAGSTRAPVSESPGGPTVDAEHLGCFHDDRGDRVLGDKTDSPDMSPAVCYDYCTAKGAAFMAVQWGFECWCSASSDLDFNRHYRAVGEDAVCDMLCFGDDTVTCGGFDSFDLYRLPTCGSPVEAYEQCGGLGYTGSTCCADGLECREMSPGCYSQCRPK